MYYTWIKAVRVPYSYSAEFEAYDGTKHTVEGIPHEDYGEYSIAPCQPADFAPAKMTLRRSDYFGPA